jgi:hypothetical protein
MATGETVLWLWRGNIDSVEHLCVPDAQLPCQDACLKSMTPDGLWRMTPVTAPSFSEWFVQCTITNHIVMMLTNKVMLEDKTT